MKTQIREVIEVWKNTKNIFSVPHSEHDYQKLVEILDGLIDEVGDDESHPLAPLMETLGSLVEAYEARSVPESPGSSIDAIKELMAAHGINQSNIPEIGSQGVVSEILAGKRELNLRQVKLLSKRFHVSPVVFIDR